MTIQNYAGRRDILGTEPMPKRTHAAGVATVFGVVLPKTARGLA